MRDVRPPVLVVSTLLLALPALPARAADSCAGKQAAVQVVDAAFADGVLKAHGTWQVTGANAILLEYRIDQDRLQGEVRTGTSGTWEMTLPFQLCDMHTLRVYVYPAVQESNRLVHCLDNGTSQPRRFQVSCGPKAQIVSCQWDCEDEAGGRRCTGTCTGEASGGRPPYLPFWGVDGAGYQPVQPPGPGPWTQPVACTAGQKISFKVRDYHGTSALSEPVERACGAP
jgi:hypothetical protein